MVYSAAKIIKKECQYLNINFERQWPSSGWTSSIPSNDHERVSLDPFPIELALDNEIKPRVRDIVRDFEDVANVARRDGVVVSSELTQVLKWYKAWS